MLGVLRQLGVLSLSRRATGACPPLVQLPERSVLADFVLLAA
jgi:hypothetical protein